MCVVHDYTASKTDPPVPCLVFYTQTAFPGLSLSATALGVDELVHSPVVDTDPVQNSFDTVTELVTLTDLTAYEPQRDLLFDQALRQFELAKTTRARRNDATELGAYPLRTRQMLSQYATSRV